MAKLLATTVTGVMNVSSTTNSANYVTTAGLDVLGVANSAQNTVAFHANGGLILAKSNINFNNTATVTIAATANGTGQVNVAFTASGGSQGATGAQGATGIQGIAGPRTLNIIIDGGGAIIATGSTEAAQSKGYIYMTDACNVAGWAIMSDANSASAVIKCDIWTAAISDFTNEVLISGTNPPQLATARQNTSASITGWTSGVIAAGNVIQFRINSNPAVVNANSVTVALNLNP